MVHSALGDRPIFYSIILTPFAAFVPSPWLPIVLRLFSACLCTLTVGVAYWLWHRLYGPRVALAGGAVLAAQPGFMDVGTQPLTEALLLLLLAAMFLAAVDARSPLRWALAGALCGLAYLTRPNGALALPALICAERTGRREAVTLDIPKRGGLKSASSRLSRSTLGALLGGFILMALPFWIGNAWANGDPFASDLQLAYAVRDVADATWNGFGHPFMRPLQFVTTHPAVVLMEIDRQFWNMVQTFASGLPFLVAFLLFLRGRQWRGLSGAVLAFGLLNLIFYALSWTVMGAVRYLLPTTLAFIGPLFDRADRLDLPPLHVGGRRIGPTTLLVAAMLFWYSPWISRLYRERAASRGPIRAQDMYRVGTDWIKSQSTDPLTVVASNSPWMVDYYTHLPAVVCPSFRRPSLVADFIRRYRVKYIVLFGRTNVEDREASIHSAHLPGRFLLLPSNVRIWDIPPGFWDRSPG